MLHTYIITCKKVLNTANVLKILMTVIYLMTCCKRESRLKGTYIRTYTYLLLLLYDQLFTIYFEVSIAMALSLLIGSTVHTYKHY